MSVLLYLSSDDEDTGDEVVEQIALLGGVMCYCFLKLSGCNGGVVLFVKNFFCRVDNLK